MQDLFVVETQRIPSSLNHSFAQSHSQSEIVGRAVAWLVRTSSPSVLAFGYRPLKQNQQGSRSAHLRGIQCVFPNTITNFLKSPPWEVLISRIGDDAMLHLLTRTMLLLQSKNGCYMQLSGPPLSKEIHSNGRALIRDPAASDASEFIDRSRMFYMTGERPGGLSRSHIFNKILGSAKLGSSSKVGVSRVSMSKGRKLATMIWHQRFQPNKKTRRMDKRMQRAAAACCVLLRNHLRCPYRRILEALCPANPRISPDSHDGGINDEENRDTNSECSILQDSSFVDQFATFAQDSSVALLHGLCWETCATQETSARSPPGRAPSQERTYAQLLSAYSSHSQVSQYVKSILMRLVPRRMWGSRRGKRQLLRAVSVFVRLKRRERMSLAHIMSSIDVSDFPWTKKAEGAMGVLSLLRQWVRFLFNELVVQILRWNFYCTETEPYGATVFYYRKAVWREIVAKWVHEHANGVLLRGPITHDEVNRMLKRRQYGYAKLRLLPKASNVRPIMNMAARLPPVGGTYFPLPANAALRPVFEVLKYEVACQPHLIGASVGNFWCDTTKVARLHLQSAFQIDK